MSEENEPLESTRDSVLYLIDGSESMARSGALDLSLHAASDSIRATAKQGDVNYDAGVIVFNVADAKHGVRVLLSLGEPRIDDLKLLIKLANDQARRADTIQSGGPSSGAIASALRVAKSEVNKLRLRSLRRIVVITDDDNPCNGRLRELEVAQTFTTDLTEMQVAIFPIFLTTTEKPKFDVGLFWHKMSYVPLSVSSDPAQRDWRVSMRPVDIGQLGASFQRLVFSKSRRKTASLRGRLIVESLEIGVKGYNVVQKKPKRPPGFPMVFVKDKDGNERREPVTNIRKVVDKWSGGELELDQSRKAFSLSSKKSPDVPVTEEQLNELRQYTEAKEAIFQVYGFLAPEEIPLFGYVGHSTLLVPNNANLQNSSVAFGSLHRSMNRLRRVALAVVTMPEGRHAPPSLGLLYAFDPTPQIFQKQHAPTPDASVGLYHVPLPFADDIRKEPSRYLPPPAEDAERRNNFEQLKGLLSVLIHKFRLETGYDPARFGNPRTAQFSSVLESLALSLEMETKDVEGRIPAEQRDTTVPRYDKIQRNVGNLSRAINASLATISQSGENDVSERTPTEPPSKRAKTRDDESDLSMDAFRKAAAQDDLHRFVVTDLKWALKQLTGKPANAKKAELVDLLRTALAESES